MIEPLLLTTVIVHTFDIQRPLTNATGFFFKRADRLYLVTSRHVFFDPSADHHPSRIEIEIHTDDTNLAATRRVSVDLYADGVSQWRDAEDSGGQVDVAAIEIDPAIGAPPARVHAFSSEHLLPPNASVEIGTSLLVLGFPMGFQDDLHRLPIARQASLASSFGYRFQGLGYFLIDARTHRGISGAPIVMRDPAPEGALRDFPWRLLGVHSARLEVSGRNPGIDEFLGLNAAWYSDILLHLTED